MLITKNGKLIDVLPNGTCIELPCGKSNNKAATVSVQGPIPLSFYEPSYFRFLSAMANMGEGNVHLRLHNRQSAEPIVERHIYLTPIAAAVCNCRIAEKIERIISHYLNSDTILEISTDGGLGNRNFVRNNKRERISVK